MNITKERLKNLIREQMNSMAEASDDEHGMGGEDPPTLGDVKFSGRYDQSFDDDAPMMPPKPVKPKGIAGTDVPMSALSDGIEAVKTKVKEIYAPGSREYARAMEVLNRISKQGGLQESDVEEGLDGTQSKEAWEKMNQAANPDRGEDLISAAALKKMHRAQLAAVKAAAKKKITKEQLKRIVKEEIKEALAEGYRGTGYSFTPAGQEKKRN